MHQLCQMDLADYVKENQKIIKNILYTQQWPVKFKEDTLSISLKNFTKITTTYSKDQVVVIYLYPLKYLNTRIYIIEDGRGIL